MHEKRYKESIVVLTDSIVDKWAVVIHSLDAVVAEPAMARARRAADFTGLAKPLPIRVA
jgi:hypothetical protein